MHQFPKQQHEISNVGVWLELGCILAMGYQLSHGCVVNMYVEEEMLWPREGNRIQEAELGFGVSL